jgi:hypothetical protein
MLVYVELGVIGKHSVWSADGDCMTGASVITHLHSCPCCILQHFGGLHAQTSRERVMHRVQEFPLSSPPRAGSRLHSTSDIIVILPTMRWSTAIELLRRWRRQTDRLGRWNPSEMAASPKGTRAQSSSPIAPVLVCFRISERMTTTEALASCRSSRRFACALFCSVLDSFLETRAQQKL